MEHTVRNRTAGISDRSELVKAIHYLRGGKFKVKAVMGSVETSVCISRSAAFELAISLPETASECSLLAFASYMENGDLHIG
jgi:hypothetical protein